MGRTLTRIWMKHIAPVIWADRRLESSRTTRKSRARVVHSKVKRSSGQMKRQNIQFLWACIREHNAERRLLMTVITIWPGDSLVLF